MKLKMLLGIFIIAFSLGAWEKDGSPIATGPGDQTEPRVVAPEGKDYFYVVYADYGESGFRDDKVYCVKVESKTGELLWPSPVLACQSDSGMWQHAVVGTLSSGLIITFLDGRLGYGKYRLYASKIGSAGNWEWEPNAVPVCTVDNAADQPQLCLDGSGEGCYVTWTDYRSSNYYPDIWAARVTSNGEVAWEVPVCTLAKKQELPAIVSSGGGCIIFWYDIYRNPPGLYGQRLVDSIPQWGSDGKLIIPYSTRIISNPANKSKKMQEEDPSSYAVQDGCAGAVVFSFYSIQRVDSLGNLLWQPAPVLDNPSWDPYWMASDGASGAFGSSGRYYCYAYDALVWLVKVDSSGNLPWGEAWGIWATSLWDTTFIHEPFSSVTDDYHGGCVTAFAAYIDDNWEKDISAIRTDSSKENRWQTVVCDAPGDQEHPYVVHGPYKGYIVVWEDSRNGDWDVYAQYIDSTGQVGIGETAGRNPIPTKPLLSVEPNPFSTTTKISSENREASSGGIKLNIYDVAGKLVKSFSLAPHSSLLTTVTTWDGRTDSGDQTPPGVYFCRLETKNYQATKKLIRIK